MVAQRHERSAGGSERGVASAAELLHDARLGASPAFRDPAVGKTGDLETAGVDALASRGDALEVALVGARDA